MSAAQGRDAAFADLVTHLRVSKKMAEDIIIQADLHGEDRDTVLRAVIKRLIDALGRH